MIKKTNRDNAVFRSLENPAWVREGAARHKHQSEVAGIEGAL